MGSGFAAAHVTGQLPREAQFFCHPLLEALFGPHRPDRFSAQGVDHSLKSNVLTAPPLCMFVKGAQYLDCGTPLVLLKGIGDLLCLDSAAHVA